MGFLTSIFGGGDSNIWTILFALAIVIVLIVGGVWVLKLVFRASGSMALGRQKRLAVIDTMALDSKRHIVLIRRDDVEHLIITGAANDLVVETGIPVVSATSRSVAREDEGAKQGRIQPTMERATAAAQRLGLSSILRKKNEAALKEEPEVFREDGPLNRLRNLGKEREEHATPSLRHTGLLRPVSELESANLGAVQDNREPQIDDSAKNEIDKADTMAMESIEEGTSSKDVGAEAETLNDNQETSDKTG